MFDVRDFGAKGDGLTDDIAAFDVAIAALPDQGGRLYVPAGSFRLSRPLNVYKSIILEGASSGFAAPSNAATMLKFDSGSGGITVHYRTTRLDSPSNDGSWSIIRNLYVENVDDGAGRIEATGIQAFCRCSISNVIVNGFAGSGIRLTGQKDGMLRMTVSGKTGFMGGGAGTQCTFSGGAAGAPQILHDERPTGNSTIIINGASRVPSAGETLTCNGETATVATAASIGTNVNGWQIDHVRITGCAIAVVPNGYGSNVGLARGIDISDCGYGILDASFLGCTWIGCETEACRSAPYSVANRNAKSIFLGCYSELGQPPSDFPYELTLVFGGAFGSGFTPGTEARIYGALDNAHDSAITTDGTIIANQRIQSASYIQSTVSGRYGSTAFYASGANSGSFFATDTCKLQGGVADGASAVAVSSDSFHALSTAGAKIHSFTNNNVEKAYIDKDGGATFKDAVTIQGAATVMPGGATNNPADIGGRVNMQSTPVGNVGGGEDTLHTYAIAANAMNITARGYRYEAAGTFANNINAKILKIYFGSAVISVTLPTTTAGDWFAEMMAIRTGSNAQRYKVEVRVVNSATNLVSGIFMAQGTLTEIESSTITVKATGTGTNNDDIVQNMSALTVL